mmetsp:Transcript_96796/g.270961  ORF Transcript_96796/g.270961 Transcript_96796/m.270961 type:complete len:207 (+) Transcript_96796:342-962(+)
MPVRFVAELREELSKLRARPVEVEGRLRIFAPLCGRRVNTTSCLWFAGVHHEGHQPDQDRLDAPQGVPKLGVEVRHAQAEPRVRFESSRGRQHVDGWRPVWVLLGEVESAPIDPTDVRRRQVMEHVVPCQHVPLRGASDDVRDRLILDVGILPSQTSQRRFLDLSHPPGGSSGAKPPAPAPRPAGEGERGTGQGGQRPPIGEVEGA